MLYEEAATDLEVLDFLELFNSTVESAKRLGISQSSCSRRYRSFSELLGIGFDRIRDQYRATTNLDVLSSLRQAAQKLRVRQLRPRITIGWLLGDLSLPGLDKVGQVLPIRPMNSWRLLSLLDQRLVDVSLMGLMEFQGLLRQPLAKLRSRVTPLSSSMLCVPIGLLEFKLLAHRDHPLQGKRNLNVDGATCVPISGITVRHGSGSDRRAAVSRFSEPAVRFDRLRRSFLGGFLLRWSRTKLWGASSGTGAGKTL